MTQKPGSFTGRERRRTTSRRVRSMDRIARFLIRLGGLGTIGAVALVCVFLVWVVIPLFVPARTEQSARIELDRAQAAPLRLVLDEYRSMAAAVLADGRVRVVALLQEDGREEAGLAPGGPMELEERRLVGETAPTCWSFSEDGFLLGFADGSVRLGRLGFSAEFLDEAELAPEVRALAPGERAVHRGGVIERTADQFRQLELEIELEAPVQVGSGAPILLVDAAESGETFAALGADGVLHVARRETRVNLLTGEETATLAEGSVPVALAGVPPRWLLLSGLGDNVFLAWEDGRLLRYDARDLARIRQVEQVDLVEEPEVRLTSFGALIGKVSLVAGDERGRLRVWFRIKPLDATTLDGARLALAHELEPGEAAVTSLAPSARSRLIAAGYADGSARVFHATSRKLLAALNGIDGPVEVLAIAPKDDGLACASMHAPGGLQLASWTLEVPHPETTVASVWRPVWYEGSEAPAHVWQSSSGTDDFEPKYGLVPLVFGTLKATVYSLFFGVPLALLAAVYTSEFMHPRVKEKVKPTIEMMASLPSVVLGFLSALILAPLLEDVVAEALVALVAIPFMFLLGAHLWQLLPGERRVRWSRQRIVAIFLAVPAGLLLASVAAGPVERALFGGDIRSWLAGRAGSGAGGWMFLFLPLSALFVALTLARRLDERIRARSETWSRSRAAAIDLGSFLLSSAAALGLALALSWTVAALGFDPRDAFLGTYVQRNALVVGFIMGFAVIPIIYTISEDALSAVPEYLRAGSLAAGATAWQTAVRVIIPTAMSGLFSAVMVGFGRAVGETMIVLMAAGNTPILEWNPFNGFRTLSANIAVELPEAVQGSTHYRMLFLAALTLFALTFVVNSVAEVVRQRFRRRAFQL
jgi:phosphate transport system permease protein